MSSLATGHFSLMWFERNSAIFIPICDLTPKYDLFLNFHTTSQIIFFSLPGLLW